MPSTVAIVTPPEIVVYEIEVTDEGGNVILADEPVITTGVFRRAEVDAEPGEVVTFQYYGRNVYTGVEGWSEMSQPGIVEDFEVIPVPEPGLTASIATLLVAIKTLEGIRKNATKRALKSFF